MSHAKSVAGPEPITSENFEALVVGSERPVLLDFWAPWCIPCTLMKRTVEKAAGQLAGEISVGIVNIDEQAELVERYGIRGTPTFVLTRHGRPIHAFSGMATASSISQQVRNALSAEA